MEYICHVSELQLHGEVEEQFFILFAQENVRQLTLLFQHLLFMHEFHI